MIRQVLGELMCVCIPDTLPSYFRSPNSLRKNQPLRCCLVARISICSTTVRVDRQWGLQHEKDFLLTLRLARFALLGWPVSCTELSMAAVEARSTSFAAVCGTEVLLLWDAFVLSFEDVMACCDVELTGSLEDLGVVMFWGM